jgi:phosphate/sulfate permease
MDNNNPQSPTPAQEKVAKRVSTIVLIGTCVLGALGMSIAIVAMFKDSFDDAKEILQILFSAILPLFGTWIGTILAYYFSKENLAAANKTVEHLVNSITSDKKLETIKAKDVMIPVAKLFYIEYKTGADDKAFNLKTHFLDFLKEKGIQRVILLDENKIAKYVIHKSTIEGFIAEQYFNSQKPTDTPANTPADPADTPLVDSPPADPPITTPANAGEEAKALTFADLKAKGDEKVQAILKDGVKFIKEDANLSDAKVLIKNYTACNDVFITKNGLANEPVLGWITNVTISENSIV